jgi:hypothetical protein
VILQNTTTPPVNLDDCLAFLLLELNVNIVKTKSSQEIVEYLQTSTKIVADTLYKPPKHQLDCVKR